ncbi:hypothetical protein GCM10027451_08720 [Geodermatophilus aquaeductus]
MGPSSQAGPRSRGRVPAAGARRGVRRVRVDSLRPSIPPSSPLPARSRVNGLACRARSPRTGTLPDRVLTVR